MKPAIQPYAIDIAHWLPDEEFSHYPEGARPKTAVFPPLDLSLNFIQPERRYLFKRSSNRYPDQFWSEIIAYHVGCLLGVQVPPAFAAYNSHTQQCGALIEWFYKDGEHRFIHGGSFLQSLIPNYDRKRGTQHNFETVQHLCKVWVIRELLEQDWLHYWAEAFLFDALIGNTDRHQDNWGFLFLASADNQGKFRLAPLFDNGTSLGHERFMNDVASWNEQNFCRYVDKGTHHMKWQIDDAKGCGHFEMIRSLISDHPELAQHLQNMLRNFSFERLVQGINALECLQLEIPLCRKRSAFIVKLIELRHQNLLLSLS